jgi:WD40 repeat protein
VVSVGFNFNGTLAATGALDGLVKIWNVSNGSLVTSLEGPTQAINVTENEFFFLQIISSNKQTLFFSFDSFIPSFFRFVA